MNDWEPPSDPRAHPPAPTPGQRIAGWACFLLVMAGAGLPLVIAIIGLAMTWHGGTWNP